MKLGILFSGGKDSTFVAYLAKRSGYEIACLISIISENKESYMFHTPSISATEIQAKTMDIPILIYRTRGQKESELGDLEEAIKKAVERYKIEAIVTGAVESVYQASRIQKICNKLNLECFNPIWQKDQFELLRDLLKNKFEIIITGVSAYPFTKEWLGRKIDKNFIEEIKELNKEYNINPAGEGGEFETFILNCPLFYKKLKIKSCNDFGAGNSWRREVEVE